MRFGAIGMWIGLLSSNSKTLRKHAVNSLIKRGDSAIPSLIEEMKSNRKIRMDVAAILVKIGTSSIEPIRKLLTEEDEDLVITARAALQALGVKPEPTPVSEPTSSSTNAEKQTEKEAESWEESIMRCIYGLGKDEFSLRDLYAYNEELLRLHPSENIEKSAERQLQLLRDKGILSYLGDEKYAITPPKEEKRLSQNKWIIRVDPKNTTLHSNIVADDITLRLEQHTEAIEKGDVAIICSTRSNGEVLIYGLFEVVSDPKDAMNSSDSSSEKGKAKDIKLHIKEKLGDAPVSIATKNAKGTDKLDVSALSKGCTFLLTTEEWSAISRVIYEGALMGAAESGDTDLIDHLIKLGAEVNARDIYGKTALMKAARRGQTRAVKTLIAAGADVEAVSKNGWTPLMLAASNGHTAAANALIYAGTDVNAIIERAAVNGDYKALRTLREAMSNKDRAGIDNVLKQITENNNFETPKIHRSYTDDTANKKDHSISDMSSIRTEIKNSDGINVFPEKIKKRGASAVKDLMTWLNDSDWRVRWVAVKTLEELVPSLSSDEVRRIDRALSARFDKEENQIVKRELNEAKSKIAPSEPSEIYDQEDTDTTPADLGKSSYGREAVGTKKIKDISDLQDIRAEIKNSDGINVFPEKIKKRGASAVKDLMTWLNDSDWRVRWVAVKTLEELVPSLSSDEVRRIDRALSARFDKEENQIVKRELDKAKSRISSYEPF